MKRFLFLAAMLISIISFSQTKHTIYVGNIATLKDDYVTGTTNFPLLIANGAYFTGTTSYTSDQTITVQQGSYKTGTITPNDGDAVITIVSIAGSYQASLVSVTPDPSDTANHLKYRITGVAAGNATVVITWKNSQNQQFTYTTTVTVTPPPPTTSITVTYN